MQAIQQIRNRRDWLSAALWDAAWLVVVACLLSLIVRTARADFVLAFHGPGCAACERMRPVERQLQRHGIALRVVDALAWPAGREFYRIRKWPTYVLVRERDGQEFDGGKRIEGPTSKEKLAQLADGLHSVLRKESP